MPDHPFEVPEPITVSTNAIKPSGPAGGVSPVPGGPIDSDAGFSFTQTERSTSPTAVTLGSVLRHKRIIFAVFLLVTMIAVPSIWLLITPKYQTSSVIRVRPTIPRIVFQTDENGMVASYWSYMNTQVSIIEGPQVLKKVLARKDVQETAWYRSEPRTLRTMLGGSPPSPLERLQDDVEAVAWRNTELINVSVTSSEPSDARVLADAVVDEYHDYVEKDKAKDEKLVFNILRETRAGLQKEIDLLIEEVGALSKQLGTEDPDIVRAQLAQRLNGLETRRDDLMRQHALTRSEAESQKSTGEVVRTPPPSGRAGGASNLLYASDAEWRRLNLQAETTRHQLAVARQQLGEIHPQIQKLAADVAHAETLLREREVQLEAGGAGTASGAESLAYMDGESLERMLKKQEQELHLLDEQIEALRSERDQKGDMAKDMAKLNNELREKRGLYESVRAQLEAKEMEEHAPGRISVESHAIEPTKPFRDRRALLSALAMGAGLMGGVALGFLRVSMDTKIREVGDVRQTTRVPFLGQLPPFSPDQDISVCPPLVAENVRMVRTALLERLGSGQHSVLITSSSVKAGKSTLSYLLARSLATLGKKVLLVEADMYRPALSARLGFEGKRGLASLLCGHIRDREAIQPTDAEKLDVLLVGAVPPEFDHDLLANGIFAACLARWKRVYDFVVLDGPPVLPVADARILASQADGTIMVLRSSHCRRAEVLQTYADLRAAGGTLLGTVLVGARSGPGYGSYGYAPYEETAYRLESKS